MLLYKNVKIKPENRLTYVRKRPKSIKVIMFSICMDYPFILLIDRLLFYLKSILGYPLNPGFAVSTDPNNSVHVHQKYILCQSNVQALPNKCIYMEKSFKLGIK